MEWVGTRGKENRFQGKDATLLNADGSSNNMGSFGTLIPAFP